MILGTTGSRSICAMRGRILFPVTEGALKRELKRLGYSSDVGEDELVSELDAVLTRITKERDVDYTGPLAGTKVGLYQFQGRKILVTEGPHFIEAEEGPWADVGEVDSRVAGAGGGC